MPSIRADHPDVTVIAAAEDTPRPGAGSSPSTSSRPVEERLRAQSTVIETDNPAFNGRYLQAEHEVALENDLIGFSGLVRCQHNAFKHAF